MYQKCKYSQKVQLLNVASPFFCKLIYSDFAWKIATNLDFWQNLHATKNFVLAKPKKGGFCLHFSLVVYQT